MALDLIIIFALTLTIIYFQLPILLWTAILGTSLLLLSFFGNLGLISLTVLWSIFILAAGFANLKFLRIKYFTAPLALRLKKQLPTISLTEKEAIEAGNVWWEKDLFCGRPHWKKLLAIPKPTLSSEEESFLNNQVEKLCGMICDWQIVREDCDLPKEAWDFLKQEKFFGMVIPKEYGGHGFSALAHSSIVVKIATRSVSAAVNTMVPNSLGPAELLLHYGTQAQKDFYLPRLAKGEEIPCFALTGPEAGSDAGSITDSGIVCRGEYEGKEVIGIKLNWDKRYITLAPIATVLGLAFRMYDPDNLLGKTKDIGITLCLIPTSHPGVEVGNRHLPLHLAFMNGPTRGKDVFIPLEWIIGGVDMAGKGWKMLMECLSIGRAISLPALSAACGKFSYLITGAYARVRKQFNTAISNFEGVEEALGNIAGYTYMLEACRMMTAGAVDLKIRPSIVSAIAKYHMTEMARKTIAHAMDVHAGHSIQVGPRNILAHAHLAIPVSITVEGANILTRNLIIFGQGAIRCHPFILREIECLSDTTANMNILDKLLISHAGFFMSNVVRNLWYGITAGKFIFVPDHSSIAPYFRQLTRMSTALALLADLSMMVLGGQLKRKERISARLGDILSYLYLASTVIKLYNDEGKQLSDLDYVKWCLETCLYNIQVSCEELCDNFPVRWMGKLILAVIFPYGKSYRKPSDHLHHKIVKMMLKPSQIRERLTQFCYVSKKQDEPTARLETALTQVEYLDPIWKKFQIGIRDGKVERRGSFENRLQAAVAAQVINSDEAKALLDFEYLHREIIKVDEFSFDLSAVVT